MGNRENERTVGFDVSRDFTGQNLETGVLENIKIVRTAETKCSFVINRTNFAYSNELKGLKATLDYIRDLGSSNIVVDVGTGTGRAWSKLAETEEYGHGLEFWATGLVDYNCHELFNGRFKNTPAEIMDGFKTASVGGIIAVYSIAYGSPRQCIDRLDNILVPGGVIKACFSSGGDNIDSEFELKTHFLFTERLKELNYDIAVVNENIVLAVKSGGLQKASDLMEKDHFICFGY